MSNAAQKRAIRNYRQRLKKRGVSRFEVLGLNGDRDLIRALARKLAQDDSEAKRIWIRSYAHCLWYDGKGWDPCDASSFTARWRGTEDGAPL